MPSDITLTEIQTYMATKMQEAGAEDTSIVKIYIIYNFKNYLNMLQKRQELTESNIELYYDAEKLERRNLSSSNY
jgi:hypothetical protein